MLLYSKTQPTRLPPRRRRAEFEFGLGGLRQENRDSSLIANMKNLQINAGST
jgi:hypothetical protein